MDFRGSRRYLMQRELESLGVEFSQLSAECKILSEIGSKSRRCRICDSGFRGHFAR